MAIFFDTGFFIALKNTRDIHHFEAQHSMRDFLTQKYGRLYSSTFIFDELVTLALSRLHNPSFAINLGKYLLNSPRITLLSISIEDFQKSWLFFQKFASKGLSFTDCTILVQCQRLDCQYLATYDSHFHGLITTHQML